MSKLVNETGLTKLLELLKEYNDKTYEFKGEGSSGGESCSCPERWNILGATEFNIKYTTTDNQPLTFTSHTKAIESHTFENGVGEMKLYYNGIPSNFFYLQETLATIEIPEGCTGLGKEVFRGCVNLSSVKLPQSMTKLGERCFQNCQELYELELPDGIKEIPNACFIGCHHLQGTNSKGDKIYDRGLTVLKLPANLEKIGDEAFEDCTFLRSSIGDEGYYTNIKIPSSLKHIGVRAFQQCENIYFADWDFWPGVEYLGEKAFQSCHKLQFPENFVMPDKITEIGQETFSFCYNIKDFDTNNVESIGSKCFMNSGSSQGSYIDKMTLRSKLKSIGKQAFASDRSADGASGGSLGSIGVYNIYVESIDDFMNIEYGDSKSHPNSPRQSWNTNLYIGDEKITELDLSNMSSDIIKSDMFNGFGSITSVKFPTHLKEIEYRAFLNTGIKNFEINVNNNLILGDNIFSGYIDTIELNKKTNWGVKITPKTFDSDNSLIIKNLNISLGIASSIGQLNFGNNTQVENLNADLASSSTIIRKQFYNNTSLRKVYLSGFSLLNIEPQAFYGCTGLEEIEFNYGTGSNSKTGSIGEQAFSGCTWLSKVIFSGNCTTLTTLDRKAFEKCPNLKTIELPYTIETIGEQCFYNSGSTCLEEIDLSGLSNLKSIGSKALYHVKKLTISSNNTNYIKDMATFCDKSNLKEVYIKGIIVVDGLNMTQPTYYVESNLLDSYQSKYPSLTFEALPA